MSPETKRWLELFGIVITAFVILLICIILESLIYLNNKNVKKEEEENGSDRTYLQSVAKENGFQGQVKNNNAILSTTILSLAKGNNGKIIDASPTDVWSALLQGYKIVSDQPIVAKDTIVQAISKLAVLKQTTLVGYQSPDADENATISIDENLLQVFQTLEAQIFATPFLFSCGPSVSISSNLLVTLLGPLLSGSLSIPSKNIKEGSILQISSSGTIVIGTSNNTPNFEILINTVGITLNIVNLTPNSYKYNFESILSFNSDSNGIRLGCITTLSINSTTSNQISTKDSFDDIVFSPDADITFDVKADFLQAIGTGTNMRSLVNSGFYFYRST